MDDPGDVVDPAHRRRLLDTLGGVLRSMALVA